MRDIAVISFLIGCVFITLKRPWLGVLALSVFAYMNPHAYAWGFARSIPAFQILFIVVAIAFLLDKEKKTIPKDWRIPVFFILWFYFFITTTTAMVPVYAWPKLLEVTKIYLPLIFTLLLINSREKLYYLIITIGGSIGLLATKGGVWAIAHGFSNRVYGPNGTQFFENNAFAIATLMSVPLLILWIRETTDKRIKYAIMAAIPLCFAAALSSFSRGALLTMGVLVPVLLWHSKRKFLALPILVIGIVLVSGALPEEWYARMGTIETYQEDASAQSRLRAWSDGIDYGLAHPLTGAGFEGWRWVTERDWHSSYVEIFAEHGIIAFSLWLSLLLGTLLSLTRLPRKTRHIPEMKWVANYCYMVRASLLAYSAGTVFLGLSYWDIFYHLIFISVLIKKFALQELAEYDLQEKKEQQDQVDHNTPLSEPIPTNSIHL